MKNTFEYNLKTDEGFWLGKIVLTQDGMFCGVTDWGCLSYYWPQHGCVDFRNFILNINEDYFASKMHQGMSYIAHGPEVLRSCQRFASVILPVLKSALEKELIEEAESINNIES